MTPKERVLAAINHHTVDRIPCGFVSTPEVDEKLMRHFKTSSLDMVLDKLGVDTRTIIPEYSGPVLRTWDDGRFENYWGHIRKAIKNDAGTYNESVEYPYAAFQTVEAVESFKWPKVEWFDFHKLETASEQYSQHALIFGTPGLMDMINGTSAGRGMEQVMFDIAEENPIGLACMDMRYKSSYAIVEKALQIARGGIDIVWIGDDFGSQNGLLINPSSWEHLFFEKINKICDLIHNHGAKVMFHSCGSTRMIWPRMIAAGVDIYDTVQPEAVDMDFDRLYADFGDKIAMHGSISTQKTLPFGSTDDVRKEVRARMNTVGNQGGFILAPAHNLQPDIPVVNILALYDEVTKC